MFFNGFFFLISSQNADEPIAYRCSADFFFFIFQSKSKWMREKKKLKTKSRANKISL